MKSIVYFLINPMTWLVIGLFFLWYKRKIISVRSRRIGLATAGLYFYLCTTPFVTHGLITQLERTFPPLHPDKLDIHQCYHIISLGGGVGKDTTLPPNSLLSTASLVRLAEGIRIYHLLSCRKLITSGFGGEGAKSIAEVAENAAITLGVQKGDLDILPEPKTTEEEAEAYTRKFGTKTPLIISTTAMHIPRAVYIFQKMGVETVIAAPTDYKKKGPFKINSIRPFIPGFAHLEDLKGYLHEVVGLWYVRWKK